MGSDVYESPQDALVPATEADGASYAEYATAEGALVFAESGGGVFDPAAGGAPEGVEPAGVEHGEGERGR